MVWPNLFQAGNERVMGSSCGVRTSRSLYRRTGIGGSSIRVVFVANSLSNLLCFESARLGFSSRIAYFEFAIVQFLDT